MLPEIELGTLDRGRDLRAPAAAHVPTSILSLEQTNLHSFLTIVTNHAGEDLYRFDRPCPPNSDEL